MLNIDVNITIGSRVFNYVHDLTITSRADNFTRTATIRLPQTFFADSKTFLFDVIKIGDPVKIAIAYAPNDLKTRFTGYVVRRVPNSPIEIYCEDESWKYKQAILKAATYEKTTIANLLFNTYPAAFSVFDGSRNIGDWIIGKGATFLGLLDKMRKQLGTTAYWDLNGVLRVDWQFEENSTIAGVFYYGDPQKANIIDVSGMTYQDANEFNQVVLLTSEQEADNDGKAQKPISVYAFFDDKGEPTVAEEYNAGGNINNFNLPGLDQQAAETLAKQRLLNINYTGYRGGFLTFGEPAININDDLELVNERQTEMEGRYRVRGINIKMGFNIGYRQEVEVARKIKTA